MKWNLEMVIEECKRLSDIKGDEFSIRVVVNGRLSTTLGRVLSTKNIVTGACTAKQMEISKKLLDFGTDNDIKKVIAHEWCHYYLTKTTEEFHGHNKLFKELCSEMGGTTGTSTVIEGYKDIKHKYETYCSCCGNMVGTYSRAGNTIKNPENYQSSCCNAPIVVIQNW